MDLPSALALSLPSSALAAFLWVAAAGHGAGGHLIHLVISLGLVGLFLVSVVDSSFVPLPIPGLTDIMLVLYAAQHSNPWMLVLIASFGSFLGGWFSYKVGQSGGMEFIQKRTPPRIFRKVTRWMETHAILAVAVPAVLPPPMPLSPFVLAAGALKMSRNKFLVTFTISRLLRHAVAAWLGVRFGKPVLIFWSHFSEKWGATILTVLWTGILLSVGYAFWQLWKTSHAVGTLKRRSKPLQSAPAA